MKYSRLLLTLFILLGCSHSGKVDSDVDPHFAGDSLVLSPGMKAALNGFRPGYRPLGPLDYPLHVSTIYPETGREITIEDPPYPRTLRVRPFAWISDLDADGRLDVALLRERSDSTQLVALLAGSMRVLELARWSTELPIPDTLNGARREWLTDRATLGGKELDAGKEHLVLIFQRPGEPLAWSWNGEEFQRVE